MLGNADQLETEYMLAEQDKMVDERELFGCENLTVRIRYLQSSDSLPGEKIGRRTFVDTFP